MTVEESLRLARLHIAYLERMLDEAEIRYDKTLRECWEHRNEARRLYFAIRDHKERVLAYPPSQDAANDTLWRKGDGEEDFVW
jgi:hypothetical protein